MMTPKRGLFTSIFASLYFKKSWKIKRYVRIFLQCSLKSSQFVMPRHRVRISNESGKFPRFSTCFAACAYCLLRTYRGMTQGTQHRSLVLVHFSCKAWVDCLFSYRAKVLVFDQGKGEFRPPSINYGDSSCEQIANEHWGLNCKWAIQVKRLYISYFNYLYNRVQIFSKKRFMKRLRVRATPSAEETSQLRFPWEEIWHLSKNWRWSKNPCGPRPLS